MAVAVTFFFVAVAVTFFFVAVAVTCKSTAGSGTVASAERRLAVPWPPPASLPWGNPSKRGKHGQRAPSSTHTRPDHRRARTFFLVAATATFGLATTATFGLAAAGLAAPPSLRAFICRRAW